MARIRRAPRELGKALGVDTNGEDRGAAVPLTQRERAVALTPPARQFDARIL